MTDACSIKHHVIIIIIKPHWNNLISTPADYYVNRTNTKQERKSKLILGPKIWAEVPSDIKEFLLKTFTKKYKHIC